ncbi:DUF6913 domain-containing protein [Solitalea koreensis]|uniref:Uncharacterized protein n=1 Tax=Solitalea koreensis TaxID=543615 RepID=A0A521E4I3_9SPHI|nr:hypothetical protein [Solitalea koreensis]SMO78843.1 hypothetical protein SAMN06265350_11126 [Solitalea koreensis]
MNLIYNTRISFGRRNLQKLTVKHRINTQIVPFNEAKNIILLFSTEQVHEIKQIKNLVNELTAQNKNVKTIGFVDQNNLAEFKAEAHNLNYITIEHLNFNLTIKEEVLKAYKQEYDILINLSAKNELQLSLIAAKLDAKFKIGRYDSERSFVYDFMIDSKKDSSIYNFVTELKHYLSVLEHD